MICSPARLAANQANAKRSTGPKTPEGKARSRANSLKHGMTGRGVVLPDEDAAEVARLFDVLEADLAPPDSMGRILVRQIALASLRLDRSAEQEAASLSRKIRHAQDDHDEACFAEVSALLDGLADDPATAVRNLIRTPEGVDALIRAWAGLRADLGRSDPRRWTAAHAERADHLTGRRLDEVGGSRVAELSHAVWGNFMYLDDHEGQGLEDDARRAWAGERLAEFIDEEVAALRECRESLDLEGFELDREEAPERALFDPSKEATLARRYEAAASRTLFRSIRELRQVKREAADRPPSARPVAASRMGSFFPEPQPPAERAEQAPPEPKAPRPPAPRRLPVAPSRPTEADRDDSPPIPAEVEGSEAGSAWTDGRLLRC